MNIRYLSFVIILHLHISIRLVHSAAAKAIIPKEKVVDTMVNGECAYFETTERLCKDEAELKYGDSNKNGRNQCCLLSAEIECLRPYVEKVCAQLKYFHKLQKKEFDEKINFKNLQCGGYQFDCPEESYNIWMMLITIFTASITIASFCIICFIYIRS